LRAECEQVIAGALERHADIEPCAAAFELAMGGSKIGTGRDELAVAESKLGSGLV